MDVESVPHVFHQAPIMPVLTLPDTLDPMVMIFRVLDWMGPVCRWSIVAMAVLTFFRVLLWAVWRVSVVVPATVLDRDKCECEWGQKGVGRPEAKFCPRCGRKVEVWRDRKVSA